MEAYQGGTCNETEVSAQCCVHLAMAARPEVMLAKPGMGFDEGFTIVKNEQERIRRAEKPITARGKPARLTTETRRAREKRRDAREGRGKRVEMLFHEDITGQIIAAAIEVHKELGPGLLESAYEECLCYELGQPDWHSNGKPPSPSHTRASDWIAGIAWISWLSKELCWN